MYSSEVNKVRLTVLITLLFSALCAGVFRTPPILFMAALLLAAPPVGFLIGRLNSRFLKVARTLPEIGTVGDVLTGEITVTNRARWPMFLIHTNFGCAHGHDDKAVITPLGSDEQVIPMLRSRTRYKWQQQWRLQRRGIFLLEPTRSGVLDPLRLGNFLSSHSDAQRIVVLPRTVHLEQLGFLGGGGQEQHLIRHSPVVADAMDFHGVRPWMPGEAIRRAHWKSTARTGQLHVIEWEETPASDLAILLDTGSDSIVGDEENNTLELAITAAASIAMHLLEHGCRIQLFYFAVAHSDTESLILKTCSAHSVAQSQEILHSLAEVAPVSHPKALASRLSAVALPLIPQDTGALLIASSQSDAVNIKSRRRTHHRTLLVDAASFASQAQHAPSTPPAAHNPQFRQNSRRARTPALRYGEPINKVLESSW
jgi:uncharacterized protein (DUF58 family)